jgi:hypothetical protein
MYIYIHTYMYIYLRDDEIAENNYKAITYFKVTGNQVLPLKNPTFFSGIVCTDDIDVCMFVCMYTYIYRHTYTLEKSNFLLGYSMYR